MSEKFATNLRRLREAMGWSQGKLARKAGFQPSAISHFETGNREPSLRNLLRLMKALDVDANTLIGWSANQ